MNSMSLKCFYRYLNDIDSSRLYIMTHWERNKYYHVDDELLIRYYRHRDNSCYNNFVETMNHLQTFYSNHNVFNLGYNDDEDEDDDENENVTNVIEIDNNSLLVKTRPFKGFKITEEGDINQDEIINEDDENPHLHLHLLTHPQQQAMHIRCSDQVCSSCANELPKSSTEIQLQPKRHSVSDMDDSPSLREDIETSECKIHGHVGIKSTKTYTTQNKCFVHGSNERGIYLACYGILLQYINMYP